MPVPKIVILTGDAAESLEVMYPYQRLREEGYEVHIAAPSKKKLHFVVHDVEPGSDPVGVVTERLVRELPLCSCASSSAAHRRLDETNSAG
jgi:putative intracellular protease/amidase